MKLIHLFTVLLLILANCAVSYAQMTDEQVISYVTDAVSQGKGQSQIVKELLSRGVTQEQGQRIFEMYKSGQLGKQNAGNAETRQIKTVTREREVEKKEALQLDTVKKETVIFGHDIFRNKSLSFEPNENLATPSNYVLGPGDEIIIDVWGLNETTITQTLTPEGRIFISQIGPIELSGLTIEQAKSKLTKALSQKYSLEGKNAASNIMVTLGKIRTIQVNVLGEVNVPGTYRLSAFTNVFNALFRAGGVTKIGSLRMVQIARDGRIAGTVDIYQYLFNGELPETVSLKDGDAIIVPTYQALVKVGEGFKRPMAYEALPGEPLEQMMNYTGGLLPEAGDAAVSVVRKNGASSQVFTVSKDNFQTFSLQDGDELNAYINSQDIFANRVEVRGNVMRPGIYALGDEVATVRQLVKSCGGLLDDAFTTRAQLIREKADRSLEVTAIAIGAIMDGTTPDIMLRSNDILVISNINDIYPKGNITVTGFVQEPGDFQFAEGMSVEDAIMLAGGLESGITAARVDVSRRITDTASGSSSTIAEIFSCTIEDGMMVEGKPEFVLQPFDIVAVRKNPNYIPQKSVTLSGEVVFPGEYVLVSYNERLSDLFARAGGATSNGYIEGATLRRKISDYEKSAQLSMLKNTKSNIDSTYIEVLKEKEYANVGINLDKAIAHPGSEYDIILIDGDEIIIPQHNNTVSIAGEVLFPNTVNFVPGRSLSEYIEMAGGYTDEAKKSKVFVVYPNGQTAIGKRSEIKPGSQIYVPHRPERRQLSVVEWLSIGTSAASLAALITSIISTLNK